MYTGTVDVTSQCIEEILEAAHYFNIASLEEQLIDFVTDSLSIDNIVDTVLFARCSKFPQLFENCLSFMYDHADSVARDISFTRLSREILLTFCNSSELKIKEVILFGAVFRWYQDRLPGIVVQRIFQEIQYPLIAETDLVSIIHPLKMADPNLYTAALEYHLVPSKYRGPLNQIIYRKHVPQNIKYINANHQYMTVSDNNNGITITKSEDSFNWNGLCAIFVHPIQQQPVHFKIALQKVEFFSQIYLVTHSYNSSHPRFRVNDITGGIKLSGLCVQQKIDGVISIRGNTINTTINGTTKTILKASVTYFCIHMNYEDDKLQFSFT